MIPLTEEELKVAQIVKAKLGAIFSDMDVSASVAFSAVVALWQR